MDVWPAVERWNEAVRLARTCGNDTVLQRLLDRHAVWTVADEKGQRLICDTCQRAPWHCPVYTEVELMLKEVGKT